MSYYKIDELHNCIPTQGACGTGKSTLGSALAKSLGFPYIEGDLHPRSNVEKMANATLLTTDTDREPWFALAGRTA